MEYHVYWVLKSSCFEIFGDGKYGIFLGKKLMEICCLLITEKFLFWTFRWWEILAFFSQKVEGKMIISWCFWGSHDIPWLGKYGFLCSVPSLHLKKNSSVCFNDHIFLANSVYFYALQLGCYFSFFKFSVTSS